MVFTVVAHTRCRAKRRQDGEQQWYGSGAKRNSYYEEMLPGAAVDTTEYEVMSAKEAEAAVVPNPMYEPAAAADDDEDGKME